MAFLQESLQQHALREILVDLRQLVAAHGEFLANFRRHTLTEEPPDSLDERSPPHPPWHTRPLAQQPVAEPPRCWALPPSITQPPPGFKAEPLPRLRVDPPRFDGDNALDWIHKMQNYYNHQYTPLHDRLYLTQYLFDHPASEWMAYWEENNKGKGWDEFLIAVKQRFEPDSHDECVGRLPALHQICQAVAGVQGASPRPTCTSRDDRQHIHNTTSPVQVQDIISTEPPLQLMDREGFEVGDVIFKGPFDFGQPTAIIAMEKKIDVDSSSDGGLKGVPRSIRGFFGDAAGLLDPYYNVAFASKCSQFCAIIEIGGNVVRAPRYYSGNKYGHLGEVLFDGVGSRATLQFGEGVRIFDPGIFESDAIDATEVAAMFRMLLYSMGDGRFLKFGSSTKDFHDFAYLGVVASYGRTGNDGDLVANLSFVEIRVFDLAKFGEKFAAVEMLKAWNNRAYVVLVVKENGAQDFDHGGIDNYEEGGFFKKLECAAFTNSGIAMVNQIKPLMFIFHDPP